MMRYWMCSAFLAAVLVIPSMQQDYDTYVYDYRTYRPMSSFIENERQSAPINNGSGNCGECGISPAATPTIVNGDIVNPTNKFPWMVTLSVNGGRICGASIISERFIMTAGHCVKSENITSTLDRNTCVFKNGGKGPCYYKPQQVTISFLTNTYEMTAGREVAEIIPHPDYQPDKTSVSNDIALIQMSETIQCSNYALPICLPCSSAPVKTGMLVIVAGWGETMDPKGRGKEQRVATVQMEDASQCKMYAGFTSSGVFCLSGKGSSSACFGDSGGPAFIQKKNKFYAIGVASATTSTKCDPSKPVMYTRVSNYIEWIKKVSDAENKNY